MDQTKTKGRGGPGADTLGQRHSGACVNHGPLGEDRQKQNMHRTFLQLSPADGVRYSQEISPL